MLGGSAAAAKKAPAATCSPPKPLGVFTRCPKGDSARSAARALGLKVGLSAAGKRGFGAWLGSESQLKLWRMRRGRSLCSRGLGISILCPKGFLGDGYSPTISRVPSWDEILLSCCCC